MIEQLCTERNLPPLWADKEQDWQSRREEIREILSREFCGFPPRISFQTQGKMLRRDKDGFGGKAITEDWEVCITSDFSHTSFPFTLSLPKKEAKAPLFVYPAFHPLVADGIGEEILDAGYGIANVYYQDMTADYYDEHSSGLGRFCARNSFDSWGKLRMWAWGCSRILDVVEKDERIRTSQMAILGHSRLGKTALLAGAFDERFALTACVQSGAGGAALFRGKTGETVENLYGKGSRLWFDGNFFEYLGRIQELPFDQHYLLSLIAPRYLYVTSAAGDAWADPVSEFLGCVAASPAFERCNMKGLVCPDRLPKTGESFDEGNIGYFLREGTHYLSRTDWQKVIAYRRLHGV